MSSIGSGYDISTTTYSNDGSLYQIMYSSKAVKKGGTAIGICCKDGVVIGTEKIFLSELFEESSGQVVFPVNRQCGITLTGWSPDSRKLVNKGRKESKDYRDFYGTNIPTKTLVERLSSHVHMYTMYSYLRPFGVATILAGYDESSGPELYMIETNGVSWGYHGVAVGKATDAAKNELGKLNFSQMTIQDGVKAVVKILHDVHDKVKDKAFHCQLGWIGKDTNGHFEVVPDSIVQDALKLAKAQDTDAGSDDEDLDAMET